MIVKVKEKFEKTRHVKNNEKSKKYILRREKIFRPYDRIPSEAKKPYVFTYFFYLKLYLGNDFL